MQLLLFGYIFTLREQDHFLRVTTSAEDHAKVRDTMHLAQKRLVRVRKNHVVSEKWEITALQVEQGCRPGQLLK